MIEIIDVEDMLVWAYRAQAVDRMADRIRDAVGRKGPAGFGTSPLALVLGLGCRVDGGAGPTTIGRSAAAVADDALTLHAVVTKLPAMMMEISEAGTISLTWQDQMASAGMRERANGRLCRGDVAVCGETIEPAILVIANARAASRPETLDDFVADFSVRPRDSSGRWIADRDSYRQSLDDVIRMRGLYAGWRAALVRIVETCSNLQRHRLVGPAAPEAPWATRSAAIVHQAIDAPKAPDRNPRREGVRNRRKPVVDRLPSTR